MRRGSSEILSRGHRGRSRLDARGKTTRHLRQCQIDLEGLESRTLLATIPAATATGAPIDLSGLSTVTNNGNAHSPTVVVDPYDSQKLFAVWGVDLSQVVPAPTPTTAIVEGAFSNNGGATWNNLGEQVASRQLDVATINATPPTNYTQITEPSVAFDGNGDVYVLSLQTSGANDGLLYLTQFNFSGATPVLTSAYNVYQWVSGSDAATDAVLSVDTANPGAPGAPDPHANNVYIAWASIDAIPASTLPTVFNPNRAELVVGTPNSIGGNQVRLAFSAVTTVNAGGNFGGAPNGGNDDAHPQLVINQTNGGKVTVLWDDFGSGSKASPAFDNLLSNLVQPGDTYGFAGATGPFLNGIPSPPAAAPTPVPTFFTDSVTVPNQAAIDNLSVTIDLVDQQTVQNLNLTLIAPDGVHSIVLVQNQNNAAGTANTGQGLPSGNAIGVFGFATGATGTPGRNVGTIFDDNATRNIFDPTTTGTNGNNATNYIGTFRPEGGSLQSFLSSLGGAINGTWTLQITNFASSAVTGFLNPGQLQHFSLQFSTGMSRSSPSVVATTLVTGALGNSFANKPPSSPSVGVGPGPVVAIDNTLGSASPDQGRIYAAYVIYLRDSDPNAHLNPTTNTDIALSYSDNGGQTWISDGIVNDDAATLDGYSGSSIGSASAYTSGRTQFQPEIAVDQATGTLVVSWRDARNDAANARVATYITTSIDGGNSFSAQTYANPSQTAIDAITGQTDILGPLGDNQSSGNGGQADPTFGYGDQMGLAVSNGHVFPVWAGNFNAAYLVNTSTVTAYPLNIWYRPMVIAAGPRIVTSSMGPIPYAEAAAGNHLVSISVTFDRPVDPNTVSVGDVKVFYHDTSNTSSSIALPVASFLPTAGGTSSTTQFTIVFNAAAAGPIYTGTYSYLIAPDNGSGLIISTPVESYKGTVLGTYDRMDQNADGTSDQNAVTTAFTGLTPGDVYAAPAPQPLTPIQFLGAASILTPPFNQNTLPLIVPGPQALSTSVPGGNSAAGNLITDGTTSTLSVTFDRPMETSSFTPSQVLQIMGPAGAISGPQFFPSTSSTGQIIPAATSAGAGVLNSTLTIPSFGGTFKAAHIIVDLNAAFSPDSQLTGVLIAPNGTTVTLFSGVGATGANFINTIFDDSAASSITTGTAPFTGTFQPTGKLSTLNGLTVDMQNSALQWVPGVWTLQLSNASTGATGMLANWSLNITPVITVTPVSPVSGAATTFTIGFPLQQ
ncbi:MAG TPA: hypothetical protein VHS97_00395, partial [Isosphaeraceae bacterium]|nr:hypothetical protein [Isosphaeraceae bacterium]